MGKVKALLMEMEEDAENSNTLRLLNRKELHEDV